MDIFTSCNEHRSTKSISVRLLSGAKMVRGSVHKHTNQCTLPPAADARLHEVLPTNYHFYSQIKDVIKDKLALYRLITSHVYTGQWI